MDLEKLYFDVKELLNKIDFNKLWPNFKPLKYALYTEELCFFDGKYIEKTDKFLANTSIMFNGEYIAIWNVLDELPIEILVSKMIHEMFHGFQMQNNESRFPNELLALKEYEYSNENLSIKYEESKLLIDLYNKFDLEKYYQFLALRKYRYTNYLKEYTYEAKIEQIEGTANFIELSVLKQLSETTYNIEINKIEKSLLIKNNYLPVRIISYNIGAFLLMVLKNNNISVDYSFDDTPFSIKILNEAKISKIDAICDYTLEINNFNDNTKKIISNALKQNNIVAEGKFKLLGVNVYNALYYKPYIVSSYFVMYNDLEKNKDNVLYGDFVIEMNDDTVIRIYQLDSEIKEE